MLSPTREEGLGLLSGQGLGTVALYDFLSMIDIEAAARLGNLGCRVER